MSELENGEKWCEMLSSGRDHHYCTHELTDALTTARSALDPDQQNSIIDMGGGLQGHTPAEEQLRAA